MSSLADQFTRFLDERRWLLNVTPKTLEWYAEMFKLLRRLHPTLTEPADLTKFTLNQFVVKMRERGLSAVSCNTRLKAVNVFVAWLHTEGLLATKFHVPPLRTEKRVLSILSTEQVKRLIQFKPKNKRQYRPAVLALLLVDRGLRIDEALTLRVEHVDFDNARPLDICGAQANVAGTCQGVPIRANQGGQSPCVNQCGDSVGLLVAVLLLEVARLGGRFGPAWLM